MPPRGCQCDRKRDYGGDGTDKPYCSERIAELEALLAERKRGRRKVKSKILEWFMRILQAFGKNPTPDEDDVYNDPREEEIK